MLFLNRFFPSSSHPNHPCVPSSDFYGLRYHWPHVRRPAADREGQPLLQTQNKTCAQRGKKNPVIATEVMWDTPCSAFPALHFTDGPSHSVISSSSSVQVHLSPRGLKCVYLREGFSLFGCFHYFSFMSTGQPSCFSHSFLYNPTMFRKIWWWRSIESCCEGVRMKGTERSFRPWTSPQANQRCWIWKRKMTKLTVKILFVFLVLVSYTYTWTYSTVRVRRLQFNILDIYYTWINMSAGCSGVFQGAVYLLGSCLAGLTIKLYLAVCGRDNSFSPNLISHSLSPASWTFQHARSFIKWATLM